MNHRRTFPGLLILLALASLACSIFIGGPDYPAEPIPVSIEAAESIKEQFKQAVEAGVSTGTVSLQLTESQITSYLLVKFAQQNKPLMREPQLYLRDGQMQLFGKVERGIFLANVALVVDVGVDEAGAPRFQVSSADFGPFPAPQGLNDAVSAVIDEAFTGWLGPIASGFRIESITIADGLMTLTGRIR